jgi:hypothetical protein
MMMCKKLEDLESINLEALLSGAKTILTSSSVITFKTSSKNE